MITEVMIKHAWDFNATQAAAMTKTALEKQAEINLEDYINIINRITKAAESGKSMIRIEKGDAIEKRITVGTINKLTSMEFHVERSYIRHCVTDSDYLGIDISWKV